MIDYLNRYGKILLKESPADKWTFKKRWCRRGGITLQGYGDIVLQFLRGNRMAQSQLEVYRIDMKYIRNLHNIDDRVLSVSPQIGKDERPFLGVIIVCNTHKYCVPLSKPKKKHEKMRDKIDFKKIIYDDTLIGVLNFNLMIPVEDAQIQQIDTEIRKHDNSDTKEKKMLLQKELAWCNEHKRDLINTANVLYQKYVSGEKFSAKNQCLDFRRMEQECYRYNEKLVSLHSFK